MKLLSSFLERYKRITPPDIVIRDSVVVLFSNKLSYVITREDVEVRGRKVFVKCPSLIKNEIMLNKKELISELLSMISPHVIDDIR